MTLRGEELKLLALFPILQIPLPRLYLNNKPRKLPPAGTWSKYYAMRSDRVADREIIAHTFRLRNSRRAVFVFAAPKSPIIQVNRD